MSPSREHLSNQAHIIGQRDAFGNADWNCPFMHRRFGDEGSFHLKFRSGNAPPRQNDFPVEEPLWVMGGIDHVGEDYVWGDLRVSCAPEK